MVVVLVLSPVLMALQNRPLYLLLYRKIVPNGKAPTANWNINELSSNQNPTPGFVSGSFNSVNLDSARYKITGQKITEIDFCQPPVSVPITLSGSCGQNIAINVQFESNNPILMTGGSFTGDVTCSQKMINK